MALFISSKLPLIKIKTKKSIIIPAICTQVFTLPVHEAASTLPFAAATFLSDVMINSRARTINTIHAGKMPFSIKISSAAVTNSLSASGSTNLPKSVT